MKAWPFDMDKRSNSSIMGKVKSKACGCRIVVITSGFQPDEGGSIPPTRS